MTTDTDAERIAELEADNQRLRRLLDLQDAPGELRHRLRSTLALLRSVIRRSANTERDLSSYAAHLEERLDAIVHAQALADQYGEVALLSLLGDELLRYGASEGDRLALSGPDVRFRPRAGQVLALAFHELAANSVEHGALGSDHGRTEVSWAVSGDAPDTLLVFTWTERDSPPVSDQSRQGFGTEVLTRMLAYDLKAATQVTTGSGGLCWTIRLPLPEQVGHVVAA